MTSPSRSQANGAVPESEERKTKRVRVNLSFTPEEWDQVLNGAGKTAPTAWCKERILLSEGFGDPLLDCVSQILLATAGVRMHQQLWVDIMTLGYELSAAVSRHPLGSRDDARVQTMLDSLDHLLASSVVDQETILKRQADLTEKVVDLSHAIVAPGLKPGRTRARPKP